MQGTEHAVRQPAGCYRLAYIKHAHQFPSQMGAFIPEKYDSRESEVLSAVIALLMTLRKWLHRGRSETRDAAENSRENVNAIVNASRDERIRAAVAAGVSKHRVHTITGIGRSTIDRILASRPAPPPPRGSS